MPLDGHISYISSKEAFALFASKEWKDPEEFSGYYEITVAVITETEQRNKENKWKVKNRRERPSINR